MESIKKISFVNDFVCFVLEPLQKKLRYLRNSSKNIESNGIKPIWNIWGFKMDHERSQFK
jgi:hypothetical protein